MRKVEAFTFAGKNNSALILELVLFCNCTKPPPAPQELQSHHKPIQTFDKRQGQVYLFIYF